MAMYAYRDKERTKKLYAKDALKEDISTLFHSPNPNCNAHMFICSLEGSSPAYFGATRPHYPHMRPCAFGTSNYFNPDNHDEDSFDFQNALNNLLIASRPVEKKIHQIHMKQKKARKSTGNYSTVIYQWLN